MLDGLYRARDKLFLISYLFSIVSFRNIDILISPIYYCSWVKTTTKKGDEQKMKRQVEIEDNLNEIIDGCKDDLKDLVINWLNDNPDSDEAPELFNDIDYNGSFHELIDGSVPIYTGDINDLWYLYGDAFEEAFDNAGIGDKDDKNWPMGWKAAAIYCYLEQEVSSWYEDNKDDIFDEWREDNPVKDVDEDEQ